VTKRAFLLAASPCWRARLILPMGVLSGVACTDWSIRLKSYYLVLLKRARVSLSASLLARGWKDSLPIILHADDGPAVLLHRPRDRSRPRPSVSHLREHDRLHLINIALLVVEDGWSFIASTLFSVRRRGRGEPDPSRLAQTCGIGIGPKNLTNGVSVREFRDTLRGFHKKAGSTIEDRESFRRREDGLPIVLHADHGPAVLFRLSH
jgi:hypothetical protein